MLQIIYRIEPKSQGQRWSLVLFLEEGVMQKGQWIKERHRKLYLEDLKSRVSKKEEQILDFLASIQLQYARKNGLGTIELNQIELAPNKIEPFLQLIQSDHLLFFQKERISLVKGAKFYFNAVKDLNGAIEAEGRIQLGKENFSVCDCTFLFPSEKVVFLWKGQLGLLEESVSWAQCKGKLTFKNEKIFKEDVDPHEVRFSIAESKEIKPLLKLSDPTLCFAQTTLTCSKSEKDLLESGFQKKGLQYFCPPDKLAEALELLLLGGWKIEDCLGREIVPMSSFQLAAGEKEGAIQIEGEVFFSDVCCSFSKLISSLKPKASLLDLGGNKAAILDKKVLEKTLPLSLSVSKGASSLLAPFLKDKRIQWEDKIRSFIEGLTEKAPIAPELTSFQAKLYPYQREGVDWLYFQHQAGLGGLLADEMGLGKTVQVLAFFSLVRTFLPILVVTPSSLVYNWKMEMEKFLPGFSPYLHMGAERKKEAKEMQKDRFIFTTYNLLRLDLALFSQMEFACVVLDESSQIKNESSLTAAAAFQLKAQSRFALNGTPIENRYEELWSQFHFLQPSLLGPKKTFLQSIVQDGFGESRLKMRPFYLKRTKEKVELQLPEKNEQIVWVEMEEKEREVYERVKKDARSLVGSEANTMQVLEKILRLRQTACHPSLWDKSSSISSAKFQLFLDEIEEIYGQNRKVLIYSQFTEMLSLMEVEFMAKGYNYLRLDGQTSPEERQKRVTSFQEGSDPMLFLISLKAGGVGLTLTAADYVFLYDPWWNEAVENQAVDRAHRIGRNKPLFIRKYITVSSIEENMLELKRSKKQISQSFDESNGSISLTREDWLHLLR